jgi:hypothetical protein
MSKASRKQRRQALALEKHAGIDFASQDAIKHRLQPNSHRCLRPIPIPSSIRLVLWRS